MDVGEALISSIGSFRGIFLCPEQGEKTLGLLGKHGALVEEDREELGWWSFPGADDRVEPH